MTDHTFEVLSNIIFRPLGTTTFYKAV